MGIDYLSGCKEPERQFALVRTHIQDLRCIPEFEYSPVMIFVERNLGFEAEHMHRALRDEELVVFYRDEQAGRTGILTTDVVKYGAMTLTNVILREGRLCILPVAQLVARDAHEARRRLREQLEIYSLQYKSPENVFQKGRVALSGKVSLFFNVVLSGERDDKCTHGMHTGGGLQRRSGDLFATRTLLD